MLHYVNYRMKVTIQDGRTLVGTLMAFDKHMNLVLGDCEEARRIKSKKASGGSTLCNPASFLFACVYWLLRHLMWLFVTVARSARLSCYWDFVLPALPARSCASGGEGGEAHAGSGAPARGECSIVAGAWSGASVGT
jgi:small nuclear ribonucleoprotein (snRNP)-like protein